MTDETRRAELTEVARRIYRQAAAEISAYCSEHYRDDPVATMSQQMEDFAVIADSACAYLLGNAQSLASEEDREQDIALFNTHLRQMIAYAEEQRGKKTEKSGQEQ